MTYIHVYVITNNRILIKSSNWNRNMTYFCYLNRYSLVPAFVVRNSHSPAFNSDLSPYSVSWRQFPPLLAPVISDFSKVVFLPEDLSILKPPSATQRSLSSRDLSRPNSLQLCDWDSSDKSLLISTVSFVTSLFFTFIMCNAIQRG